MHGFCTSCTLHQRALCAITLSAKSLKRSFKWVCSMAAQHCKARLHPKKASGTCGQHTCWHCMPVVHAAPVSIDILYTVASLQLLVCCLQQKRKTMSCLSHHESHNTEQQQRGVPCLLSACQVAVGWGVHTRSHNSSRTSCWPHSGHSCGCR